MVEVLENLIKENTAQAANARRCEARRSPPDDSDDDLEILWLVVEEAPWSDAEFLGRWLLAVAQAETFFRQARRDPAFARRAGRVWGLVIHDFGIAAFHLLMKLKRHRTCCALPLDGYHDEGELAEAFVMLVGMGFYREVDNGHYQMATPTPTLHTVKAAVAKYAATEDKDHRLHPEWLVAALPKGKAQARVAQVVASRNGREEGRAPPHFSRTTIADFERHPRSQNGREDSRFARVGTLSPCCHGSRGCFKAAQHRTAPPSLAGTYPEY